MTGLVTKASDALSRGDADTLEALCAQLPVTLDAFSSEERAACERALIVFRRQVLAARGNVTLRERLLATRVSQEAPWVR